VSDTDTIIERIDWAKGDGLVPAIVQHADNGSVLMLGYMNRDALRSTLQSGRVVFFSRSKQRLWQKGETSGHYLELRSIQQDCDADTLLVLALPAGPVCHTGSATCFGDLKAFDAAPAGSASLHFLTQLEQIIAQRVEQLPQGSYTARLYQSGLKRVAQKVGEEGLEVALAAVTDSDQALLGECADLLYHLLVLLRARKLSLQQVVDALGARHDSTMSTAGSRRL
jgi:phosphoribosyl-AMP cyclohydrolase / phosphoribosyl-ATP pyrophosphohydrolase